MNIAALSERITFQRQETIMDAIGNHLNAWFDSYSCYATISDSQGKTNTEEASAGQTLDTSDIGFTVRYCKATSDVTTTGFRIVWKGEFYNIVKIDHLNMKKKALKFKCVKERR